MFCEHGMPKELIYDNGSCYASKEFMAQYETNHAISSLHYHKYNRLAENYMGTIKDVLKKATDSGQDLHCALVIYRSPILSNGLPLPKGILSKCVYVDLPMSQLRQSTLHQQRDMDDLNL